MAKVKKVNPNWHPIETREIKNEIGQVVDRVPYEVGDIIEITDYRQLVRSGAAVLVDEFGNEVGMPGEKYRCAVCTKELDDLANFVSHVQAHRRTTVVTPVVPEVNPQVAANAAAVLAQMPTEEQSIEEQPVIVPQTPVTPEPQVDDVKAKRLAALARAREVRAAKAQQASGQE